MSTPDLRLLFQPQCGPRSDLPRGVVFGRGADALAFFNLDPVSWRDRRSGDGPASRANFDDDFNTYFRKTRYKKPEM